MVLKYWTKKTMPREEIDLRPFDLQSIAHPLTYRAYGSSSHILGVKTNLLHSWQDVTIDLDSLSFNISGISSPHVIQHMMSKSVASFWLLPLNAVVGCGHRTKSSLSSPSINQLRTLPHCNILIVVISYKFFFKYLHQ